VSEIATAYVRRHLLVPVNRTKGLILMCLADVADDTGRAKMTQPMVAIDLGAAVRTVQKAFQSLQRDKYLVKGGHHTYVICGVQEHDIMVCPHVECAAEAGAILRGATSARKRALAAERARRARARRKAAQTV
jgi:hypothetical protein